MKTIFPIFMILFLTYSTTAQKTWNGSIGNWSDANKWSPSGVPANTDDVIINSGTITLDITDTIASLDISGGSLTGTTVSLKIDGDLDMSAGTLHTHQKVEICGNMDWSGGTIGSIVSNTDSVIVEGFINVTPGIVKTIYGRFYCNGGGSWLSDGTGDGNVTIKWSWWFLNPGYDFTFNHIVNTELSMEGGGSSLNAYSNLYKTGIGETTIKTYFNMTDTLDIQAGKMKLNGQGGNMSGVIINPFHHGLQFLPTVNSGSYKFKGIEIGDSTVLIDGGTIQVDSNSTISSIDMIDGEVNGIANLNINGDLDMMDGTFYTLDNINISGDLDWSGGFLGTLAESYDTIMVAGKTNISSTNLKYIYTRLISNGGDHGLVVGQVLPKI